MSPADSTTIEHATASITNTSNGERWQTLTHAGGRYTVEYLSPGGPYTAEVRAIGFALIKFGSGGPAQISLTPSVPGCRCVVGAF